MKLEKALPALLKGKKIRKNYWSEERYVCTRKGESSFLNQDGYIYIFSFTDFEEEDWEIVEEKKKVKLRDITEEQWEKWRIKCGISILCSSCPFSRINCSIDDISNWFYHKDLYSDKFLDQEIEVEE